ncbi:MAG: winged helix-turn-helix transcriptional regulator [Planctomycetes bacterium]|jgi:ArsR family transcriptional regulator|nr:winged helix-turn-helix transcriptional regulator [Planctomycetota bacterium]
MIGRDEATSAFKAVSEPTRLRMLRLLTVNNAEMCVCEFVDALGERQYNVSRQLKILETAGLIRGEKEGRWIYYRLSAKKDPTAAALYRLVTRLPEDAVFAADQQRFRERMCLRSDGRCRVGIQTPSLTS